MRNFIFGAEDSLVSTVGLLSGVSFAGLSSRAIIISGIILILVEALSMGAGVFIAEDSANEVQEASKKDNSVADSIIMLISYLLIGIIPLLSYLFFDNTRTAFYWSVASSLLALFVVGVIKGIFVQKNPFWSGLKITLIGAFVIALAVGVGYLAA